MNKIPEIELDFGGQPALPEQKLAAAVLQMVIHDATYYNNYKLPVIYQNNFACAVQHKDATGLTEKQYFDFYQSRLKDDLLDFIYSKDSGLNFWSEYFTNSDGVKQKIRKIVLRLLHVSDEVC